MLLVKSIKSFCVILIINLVSSISVLLKSRKENWYEPEGDKIIKYLGFTFVLLAKITIFTVLSVHAQLSPTLCNPMDCSSPGSSVSGISQARILE